MSEEWKDRDGDGIPDIYDREPDVPAKNAYERHIQDKREDWLGPQIHTCPLCLMKFESKNALDRHFKKMHT